MMMMMMMMMQRKVSSAPPPHASASARCNGKHQCTRVIDPAERTGSYARAYRLFRYTLLGSVLFGAFFIPYTIAFSPQAGWAPYDDGEAVLFYVLTAVWATDMVLTFNTGFYERGNDEAGGGKAVTVHLSRANGAPDRPEGAGGKTLDTAEDDDGTAMQSGDANGHSLTEEGSDDGKRRVDEFHSAPSRAPAPGRRRAGPRLVTDRRRIALRYLRFEFWLDLLSVLPVAEFVELGTNSGTSENLKRYLLLFRLPRLLQVRKLWTFIIGLEADIRVPHAPVAVFKYIMFILMLANFSACALYFLARLQDFGPDTYLAPILHPDAFVAAGGVGQPQQFHSNVAEDYVASLYWSVVTFTTVGYGDFSPGRSTSEQIYAMVYMLVNMIVLAYLLAIVTMLVVKGSAVALQHSERSATLRSLRDLSSGRPLPDGVLTSLQQHLEEHYGGVGVRTEAGDGSQRVMAFFPRSIQRTVNRHMYVEPLRASLLFTGVSDHFINFLFYEMRTVYYAPFTTVLEEGETCDDLYLILKGSARLVAPQSVPVGGHDDEEDVEEVAEEESIEKTGAEPDADGGTIVAHADESKREPDGYPGDERSPTWEEAGDREFEPAQDATDADADACSPRPDLAEGSLLGASFFFARSPCSSHVITTSASTVGAVSRALWHECIDRYPFDCRRIVANMYMNQFSGGGGGAGATVAMANAEIRQRVDASIMRTVASGDLTELQRLREEAGLDIGGAIDAASGRNPYHLAADSANADVLRWLLSNDIDGAGAEDFRGDTPLDICLRHNTAAHGACAAALSCSRRGLAVGGGDLPDAGAGLRMRALMKAVDGGDGPLVDRLLRYGRCDPLGTGCVISSLSGHLQFSPVAMSITDADFAAARMMLDAICAGGPQARWPTSDAGRPSPAAVIGRLREHASVPCGELGLPAAASDANGGGQRGRRRDGTRAGDSVAVEYRRRRADRLLSHLRILEGLLAEGDLRPPTPPTDAPVVTAAGSA